jgi:hypothetical protein
MVTTCTEDEMEKMVAVLAEKLDSIRINSKDAVQKLREKIQQVERDGRQVKFLSFGVGAAGLNLNSSGALRLFREYSEKYTHYLGSTVN